MNEGVASGEVSYDGATIWARVDKESKMNLQYDDNTEFLHPVSKIKSVDNSTDFAGKIRLDGLKANTKYFYKVWFSNIGNVTNSSAIIGSFRTAPDLTSSSDSTSFILGADIGGQGFCREVNDGYL
ncbi:MAG TPA: PhoD-like phosphatase N-terminal domain-containing protein, partial [Nitrososphaeraceae archaeon]|nr:PhoD-like phosphatase N-terminal domain-containing protein [Nitrososphaeraceae archaeon]